MTIMLRHLPNFLTALRLAAAPTTAGLLVAGHFNAAFGIFAAAGLSDAADGFLAKRFGLDSPLGRVLDPVADKALMLAAFVTLALLDDVPVWLAAIVIARDGLILLGLAIAVALPVARRVTNRPSRSSTAGPIGRRAPPRSMDRRIAARLIWPPSGKA